MIVSHSQGRPAEIRHCLYLNCPLNFGQLICSSLFLADLYYVAYNLINSLLRLIAKIVMQFTIIEHEYELENVTHIH